VTDLRVGLAMVVSGTAAGLLVTSWAQVLPGTIEQVDRCPCMSSDPGPYRRPVRLRQPGRPVPD
jgi:hypothetical protein